MDKPSFRNFKFQKSFDLKRSSHVDSPRKLSAFSDAGRHGGGHRRRGAADFSRSLAAGREERENDEGGGDGQARRN